MSRNDAETNRSLERAVAGDADAWRALIARHHDRLRRLIHLRLDPRLRGRLDPSDVLQEAYIDAAKLLPTYIDRPGLPFYLWLRQLTANRLAKMYRFHLGARKRDVRFEVPLYRKMMPEATSSVLAEELVGRAAEPDQAAGHQESIRLVRAALDGLDPLDREALVLRHFEQMSGAEAAEVLGITPAAAGKRYVRALTRLKTGLARVAGRPRGTHPVNSADVDPIDALADEFVDRCRRGDRPAAAEYIARYPALADRIRDLFPALLALERVAIETAPRPDAVADQPGRISHRPRGRPRRHGRRLRGGAGIAGAAAWR